ARRALPALGRDDGGGGLPYVIALPPAVRAARLGAAFAPHYLLAVSDLAAPQSPPLPEPFRRWFATRGWAPRPHQLDLLASARAGKSVLLIAPTGAGKTLAGFLPSLTALAERPKRKPGEPTRGVHTLYISPLKALAVDIERNLSKPVAEMALPVT